jgi:hypothetical protein
MRGRFIGWLVLGGLAVVAAVAPWSPRWLGALLCFYFGWQTKLTEALYLERLRARAKER